MPAQTRNVPSSSGSQTQTMPPQSIQQSLPSLLARQAHIRKDLVAINNDKQAPRRRRRLAESAIELFASLGDQTVAEALAGLTVLDLAIKAIQSQTQEQEIRDTLKDLLDVDNLTPEVVISVLMPYSKILVPQDAVSESMRELSLSIERNMVELLNIKSNKKMLRDHRDLATVTTNLAKTLTSQCADNAEVIHKLLSLTMKAIDENAPTVKGIRDNLEDLLEDEADAAAINDKLDELSNSLHDAPDPPSSAPPPSAPSTRVLREFMGGKIITEKDATTKEIFSHDISLSGAKAYNQFSKQDFSIIDRQTGGEYVNRGTAERKFGHKFVFG